MTRLGHSDMTAILDLVGTSRSFPDLPSFREGVLPGLGDLVPCDLVGYNEVDARRELDGAAGPARGRVRRRRGNPGAAGPPAPLELPGERGRLSVTCFREGDSTVLLLEEHRSGPDATRLRELGLTRREAEVLELVAIGRTNAQIADVLVVSPATVRKHLEKIYAKLGVHSRTEAAARAHGSPAADPG